MEGIDYDVQKLNELLRVPFDFCSPTVKVEIERIPCIDDKGRANHVIVMHIEPSMEVHANQAALYFYSWCTHGKTTRNENGIGCEGKWKREI